MDHGLLIDPPRTRPAVKHRLKIDPRPRFGFVDSFDLTPMKIYELKRPGAHPCVVIPLPYKVTDKSGLKKKIKDFCKDQVWANFA